MTLHRSRDDKILIIAIELAKKDFNESNSIEVYFIR